MIVDTYYVSPHIKADGHHQLDEGGVGNMTLRLILGCTAITWGMGDPGVSKPCPSCPLSYAKWFQAVPLALMLVQCFQPTMV